MKYKIKFTEVTIKNLAPRLSFDQRRFLSWLITSDCRLYFHPSISFCACGEQMFFIGSALGKNSRGQFCPVCAFKDLPGL